MGSERNETAESRGVATDSEVPETCTTRETDPVRSGMTGTIEDIQAIESWVTVREARRKGLEGSNPNRRDSRRPDGGRGVIG